MTDEMILAPESIPSVQPPSVASMMQAIIHGGVTRESVDVMRELMAMQERQDKRRAEQEFAAAFAKLQRELPKIKPTKAVMSGESVRYRFAEYDAILDIIQPHLTANNFSLTADTERGDKTLTAIVTLLHANGESRTSRFTVRTGGGPPGTNEQQQDGSSRSYAKRYALSDLLNLNIDRDADDDGKLGGSGATITADQSADLRAMLSEYCPPSRTVDEHTSRFCAAMGVESLEALPAAKMSAAVQKIKQAGAAK